MPDSTSELDRIDPEPAMVTLASGLEVEVVRLRTRQLFRLLKVLTHGAGQALLKTALDFSSDGDDFAQRLMSVVLISIPDAEQETIDFVQSMVRPAGLLDKPYRHMSKKEKEEYDAAFEDLAKELWNPELEDLIELVQAIVQQEAPEIQALGKKVASLVELASKTGQLEDAKPETVPVTEIQSHLLGGETREETELEETASPARSRRRSTSSAASTDGPTSESSTSRSAGSARSRRRLETV